MLTASSSRHALRSRIQINPWREHGETAPTSAPSGPHGRPEHDDVVQKADGARSQRQAQYSWHGARCKVLPAGATRKLLREPKRQQSKLSFLLYVKVHFRCVSCIVADTSEGDVRLLGTRKQYMVGNFGPGV
jgi:hypothetical protein